MADGDGFFCHHLFGNHTVLMHQHSHAMAQGLKFGGAQLTGPAFTTHQRCKGFGRIYSQAPTISFPVERHKT